MADERYTFEQARLRLEEIASEVRKKDTSLEKSLDLLEEGVRLANICTDLVDHTDIGATVPVTAVPETEAAGDDGPTDDPAGLMSADDGAAESEGHGAGDSEAGSDSDDRDGKPDGGQPDAFGGELADDERE